MDPYTTRSPILFLIFNRPDTTQRVFNEIRMARPSKLYIASDGPRHDNENDTLLCKQTLSIVGDVDWECTVKTLYRDSNLGCKEAISSAITWFFEQEEEGIVLEDDCLPSPSFFPYCDTSLEKYRLDTRIRHIAGCSLQLGARWGSASTYFANQTHVWGWASWKRVWKDYDKDLSRYNEEEAVSQLEKIFTDPFVIEIWQKIFRDVKAGKIDTWDYQLAFLNYFNNSLSINPNINLISNIGFRADATHTFDTQSKYANLPLGEIKEITYPSYVTPERDADYAVFVRDFKLAEKWEKHNSIRRRIRRWFRSLF